ncbi:MAG: hypothetical protein JW864_17510 [Spirochaetes bacterium]|nr:hypothetical protein [Spirochaetota bacterium]
MNEKIPQIALNREKLNTYLLLFGLRENFSLEELSASYRVLAKLNHPDISKEDNSIEAMTEINEGYHFLKEVLSSGALTLQTDNAGQRTDRETWQSGGKFSPEDIFYNQYKKGFTILKKSFELYYGDNEDKSLAGNVDYLKKELLRAKIEFSTLINDLPYNQWVNDAIDKINSINKWLD